VHAGSDRPRPCKASEHAWDLIERAPTGFPWLAVAGKTLTGWLVIDMDATLVTSSSDKEGAAPTWNKGLGFHPLAAWCANTRECLNMLLRPGNAGSSTFTDHQEVLAAALRQVPAAGLGPRRRGRRQSRPHRVLAVPVLPAEKSAVHLQVDHHGRRRGTPSSASLPPRGSPAPRRTARTAEENKHTAEITVSLMIRSGHTRPAGWPRRQRARVMPVQRLCFQARRVVERLGLEAAVMAGRFR
jgi:hypothetical protein